MSDSHARTILPRAEPYGNDWLRVVMFAYSCCASLLLVLWYGASFKGHISFPSNVWIVETLFACYAILLLVTHRRFTRPAVWEPLFRPSALLIGISRAIMFLALVNFIVWCFVIVTFRSMHLVPEDVALQAFLASFLLLNTICCSFFWALHPENLFNRRLLRFFENPLFYLLLPSYRSNFAQRAMKENRIIQKDR